MLIAFICILLLCTAGGNTKNHRKGGARTHAMDTRSMADQRPQQPAQKDHRYVTHRTKDER